MQKAQRTPSVDLDQAGAKDGVLGDGARRGEWASALGDGGDGQAVHFELVEWKIGVEDEAVTLDGDVGDVLDDGQVLLVDVDQRHLGELAAHLGPTARPRSPG